MVDVDAMSVSQLRAYLREAGADTSACFEKVSYPPSEASPFPIFSGRPRAATRRRALPTLRRRPSLVV